MIDLHSHVLPGVDDGARDLDEAVRMCRAAAADGVFAIAATPHVRHDHPTTADALESALAGLRTAVGAEPRLLPGGELDLAELARPLDELRRFALAGNPGYLLVEMPYHGWPLGLTDVVVRLRADGITAVVAHPERNPDVQNALELLRPAVDEGALVQLTAASVDGRLGRAARACARGLLDAGLAHLVASDAHSPGVRAIGLSSASSALGGGPLARWLTLDVPRAIVEHDPLPPRPPALPRRHWWARR